MDKYKRVGITAKSGLEYKSEAVKHILSILDELGVAVLIDPTRIKDPTELGSLKPFTNENDIDLLIVVGGDGTVLRAVREFHCFNVPILTINKGTVGFLSELELDELDELLPDILNGNGKVEERGILDISAFRGKKKLFSGYALNDAVIAQGTIARLVDLHTTVNDEELTTFHADGLIVSTPTGSTAYSLAAGGPIVHPKLGAIILTPIKPHSFRQKPILISSSSKVNIEVATKQNKFRDTEVILTIDGQEYVSLKHGDHVLVCGCNDTVQFLRRKQDTFFGTLRQKLKWGEQL